MTKLLNIGSTQKTRVLVVSEDEFTKIDSGQYANPGGLPGFCSVCKTGKSFTKYTIENTSEISYL